MQTIITSYLKCIIIIYYRFRFQASMVQLYEIFRTNLSSRTFPLLTMPVGTLFAIYWAHNLISFTKNPKVVSGRCEASLIEAISSFFLSMWPNLMIPLSYSSGELAALLTLHSRLDKNMTQNTNRHVGSQWCFTEPLLLIYQSAHFQKLLMSNWKKPQAKGQRRKREIESVPIVKVFPNCIDCSKKWYTYTISGE